MREQMTLADFRARMERRYWQDLLGRLPSIVAAARVARIHPVHAHRRLFACGVDRRTPGAPSPPMKKHEVGLSLRDYMDRHERWYWWRLLGCRKESRRSLSAAAPVAGMHRDSIYNHLKRLGIKPWKQPDGMGGNAAWRSLGGAP